MGSRTAESIWIDIDNIPHVLLFRPLIELFESRGVKVYLTARKHAFSCKMLEVENMDYTAIGRHWGRRKSMKILGTLLRVAQLYRFSLGKNIDISLSHGSRSHVLASFLRSIPSISMFDYEFVKTGVFSRYSSRILIPDMIAREISIRSGVIDKVMKYDGFKEMIYLHGYRPSSGILRQLGLDPREKIVVIRPPAKLAHYHNSKSETILLRLFKHFSSEPYVQVVLICRTRQERIEMLAKKLPRNFIIPELPIKALDLMYYSDMVISGGGTMNRESALMNVPTVSIFTGQKGSLDSLLERQNRLTFITDPGQVNGEPLT